MQLAQRRETVAHVASGVAHDLGNLVAVVSGTVSILAGAQPDEASVKNGLLRIGRAMEAARDLVHGLGDLGRPDAPRVPVDLRAAIVEAVDLLGTERVRRNGVHSELPPTPQLVMANRTELLQVMINLALNACEAEGDRPNTVTLKVFPDDAQIPQAAPDVGAVNRATRYRMFSVSDHGTGIPDDLRPRLFDRYVTTKGIRGTGLGLPIVATIVRQSGGALWVNSTPDVGTTMSVAWAVEDFGPNRSGMAEDDGLGPLDLDGMRILVVDDNIDVADSLTEILESHGAIAVALSDPCEASELIKDNPQLWSLVVTDHDMPVMNGKQLAEVAAACTPPLPCILVTALPDDAGWSRQHFAAVLAKPLDNAAFLHTIVRRQRPWDGSG